MWDSVALGVAVAFCWFAAAICSALDLIQARYSVLRACVWGCLGGPLTTVWLLWRRQNSTHLVCVVLGAGCLIVVGWFDLDWVRLLPTGFVVGIAMAVWLKRPAFAEALWIVALAAMGLAAFPDRLILLFEPGQAPLNAAVVLLSWGLLLLLCLVVGGCIGYLFLSERRLPVWGGYELWLGLRLLTANSRSHAISFIALLSVCATGMGSCGTVVVLGVMNGFHADLRDKILGANAHVVLLHASGSLADAQQVIARTQKLDGVAGASAFVLSEGMVSADKQLSGAVIKGIDVDRVDQVNTLRSDLVAGSLAGLQRRLPASSSDQKQQEAPIALPGIAVGQEMAQQMDLDVGDTVQLVSPLGEELGPAGPIPKAAAFRVAAIFYSGYFEYDAKFVYIGLQEAQRFFGLGHAVTGIEYATHTPETANITAIALQQALGGYPYHTRDWRQMSHSLFSALQLEKLVMALILIALVAMASLLILVVLVMVAMQRRMQIAILKSVGASDVSIAKVFVTYGLAISSAGALAGVAIGVTICRVLSWAPVGLDPQVYYISQVPIQLHAIEVAVVAVAAVILGFLATVPAALFAARQLPVEGLRDG